MIRQTDFFTVADGKRYRMMDLGEHVAHWSKAGLSHRQAAMNFFAVQSAPWALTDQLGRNGSDRVGVLIDGGGHAEGQVGRRNW